MIDLKIRIKRFNEFSRDYCLKYQKIPVHLSNFSTQFQTMGTPINASILNRLWNYDCNHVLFPFLSGLQKYVVQFVIEIANIFGPPLYEETHLPRWVASLMRRTVDKKAVNLLRLMTSQGMWIPKSTPTIIDLTLKFFLLMVHFFNKSLYNLGLRFDFCFQSLDSVQNIFRIFCHFLFKFWNFWKFGIFKIWSIIED